MKAEQHLRNAYPELVSLFDGLGPVALPNRNRPVCEAVVRTVVGQMLSGAAGEAIYQRLVWARDAKGLTSTIQLDDDTLAASGVSGRKRRTIVEFADAYSRAPDAIDGWAQLDSNTLFERVGAMWGMSDWTAAMLAIFQFGHEDVFPLTDGSIVRAVRQLESNQYIGRTFDPDRAAPFRSYLSLYLWKSLDDGFWRSQA